MAWSRKAVNKDVLDIDVLDKNVLHEQVLDTDVLDRDVFIKEPKYSGVMWHAPPYTGPSVLKHTKSSPAWSLS